MHKQSYEKWEEEPGLRVVGFPHGNRTFLPMHMPISSPRHYLIRWYDHLICQIMKVLGVRTNFNRLKFGIKYVLQTLNEGFKCMCNKPGQFSYSHSCHASGVNMTHNEKRRGKKWKIGPASNSTKIKWKCCWSAYGTKTALYSCSRQITHRSGISLSLFVLSDPFSSFSSGSGKHLQLLNTISQRKKIKNIRR